MLNEEKALFTIGQFAALHGINKKTLMWYDEIGLFQPAVVKEENGYRYYNYYQSSVLETILMLRDLNVSLPDIKAFLDGRSAVKMKSLLEEKIEELDDTIYQLKAIRKKLSHHCEDMTALLHVDLSEIKIVEKEPQYLVTVETSPDKSLEEAIGLIISQTQKYRLPHMYHASYGSMICVDSLYAGDFQNYSKLFIEIPKVPANRGLHQQPGGSYLQAYSKGSWEKLPLRYEAILSYAEKHNLLLTGCSYEVGMNEMVIDTIDDYITKIEIPISERN